MARINFQGVKTFEPVPAGTYHATLTKGSYAAQGKHTPDPVINCEYTIDEGDHSGSKVFKTYSSKETALWVYKRDMVALGTDPVVFGDPDGIDPDEICAENIGAGCYIVVEIGNQGNNDLRKVISEDRFNPRS